MQAGAWPINRPKMEGTTWFHCCSERRLSHIFKEQCMSSPLLRGAMRCKIQLNGQPTIEA